MMILTVDMGNTDITFGFFDGSRLTKVLHMLTDRQKTVDEYRLAILNLVSAAKIDLTAVSGGIMASVVPPLTQIVQSAVETVFSFSLLLVGAPLKTGLAIHIDNPAELGADLAADAVGTKEIIGFPAIIVDLGTATKIVVIDKNGAFIGGVFTPGLKISVQALVGSTSLLPEIALVRPNKIIGRNTTDSMNGGAIFGCAAMIRGMVNDIENELGYTCHHVLMGGYANLVRDLLPNNYVYSPDMVLQGLRLIYEKNISFRGNKNA